MTTDTVNTEAVATAAASESAAETIRRLHTENPDMPLTEVAKQANKPTRYVYMILYQMRKKQQEEKAARKAAREAKKAAAAGAAAPAVAPVAKRKPGRPSKAEVAARASKESTVAKVADAVHRPAHYTDGGIEVIDVLKAKLTSEEFRGYLKGSVIKYATRMGKKDGAAPEIDAGKMAWYAARLASEAKAAGR